MHGCSLLAFHVGMTYGSALFKKPPYDIERDFRPMSCLTRACASTGTSIYVSNHQDGDISGYVMAADTGRLIPTARAPAGKLVMSMASGPGGDHLYAVVRTEPYSVYAYRTDSETGILRCIGTSPLPASMVYIAVDRTGRWLLTAGYGSNTLCVQAIGRDGLVSSTPSQFVESGGVKPHAIRFDSSNRFVYVPHLGTDEVRIYVFDAGAGTLSPAVPATVKVTEGTGPRHFVLSRGDRFLYMLGQLTGVVTVFDRDPTTGGLAQIQAIESVAPGSGLLPGKPRPPTGAPDALPSETTSIWCADIQITPDGRFVYTTERAKSTITILAADTETGLLRHAGHVPTEKQPRGIAIDPGGRFLVASGEMSSCLSVYAIDSVTGALTRTQRVPAGAGANWVEFVETR
ncbi:MAG: lactonase family protein [Rhodoplanes sp.]|uniref:lactonase family protein n=1 Tax=Rhodoplanes sp. TaxID=1968906 RepID=UPI0017CCCB2F|nr:lactonase family protein [Rhodoplanes sp.]NVO15316.1 lactonase family protein [Rhodoplanes sp.]